MMLWLFAQEVVKTQPTDPVGWLLQGGALGILGLLAWFFVKKVPPLVEKFLALVHEDREAMLKGFKEEIETVRIRCDQQAAADRALSAQQIEAERARADARTTEIAKSVSQSIKGLQDDIKENTVATRDLVLEIRDNTGTIKKVNGKHD